MLPGSERPAKATLVDQAKADLARAVAAAVVVVEVVKVVPMAASDRNDLGSQCRSGNSYPRINSG